MAITTKLVSYEEWLRMPVVEDAIEEVVNGEIVTIPPPKGRHGDIVDGLADLFKKQLDLSQWRVRSSTFGLVISQEPLVMRVPDLAVFRKSRAVERDGYFHSPPELIVEVLSPGNSRRERSETLSDYENLGVPEVWVISPEAMTVEVLLLKEGKLSTAATLREGLLHPTQFPETAIDIVSIWPE